MSPIVLVLVLVLDVFRRAANLPCFFSCRFFAEESGDRVGALAVSKKGVRKLYCDDKVKL
jgi:hypothetical protein